MVALVMSSYSGSRKRRRAAATAAGEAEEPVSIAREAEGQQRVPHWGTDPPYHTFPPGPWRNGHSGKGVKCWKAVGYSWGQIPAF